MGRNLGVNRQCSDIHGKGTNRTAWANCTVSLSVHSMSACGTERSVEAPVTAQLTDTLLFVPVILPQTFPHGGKNQNGGWYMLRDRGKICLEFPLNLWVYHTDKGMIMSALIWVYSYSFNSVQWHQRVMQWLHLIVTCVFWHFPSWYVFDEPFLVLHTTGCYIHPTEDTTGWDRSFIYLPNLWAVLSCRHDSGKSVLFRTLFFLLKRIKWITGYQLYSKGFWVELLTIHFRPDPQAETICFNFTTMNFGCYRNRFSCQFQNLFSLRCDWEFVNILTKILKIVWIWAQFLQQDG